MTKLIKNYPLTTVVEVAKATNGKTLEKYSYFIVDTKLVG